MARRIKACMTAFGAGLGCFPAVAGLVYLPIRFMKVLEEEANQEKEGSGAQKEDLDARLATMKRDLGLCIVSRLKS
eukprot:317429-Pelagomonas_calceolata.AAC.2